MDNLIKEEILRINELMNTKILNESEYKECSRFSNSPQKLLVCRKIASLKSWLHKDDGLGMKNVINNKIEDLKTDIPQNLKQQFIQGANLLFSLNKINERQRDYFINNKVNTGKLVYINGDWQLVNKLNTNYSDLAEMITDMLYKGGDRAKPIIQNVIRDPKSALSSIQPKITRLVDKYFEDPNVLIDYTKNIERSTSIGEIAEKQVEDELITKGFTTNYSGGNGDLIDMSFGTDLIMTSPEHGTKTIQVKNSERAWDRSDEYPYVDWVIISDPFTIYDNKTKEVVEL
jgi:hypothetical protein